MFSVEQEQDKVLVWNRERNARGNTEMLILHSHQCLDSPPCEILACKPWNFITVFSRNVQKGDEDW